jgi:hypothetical protein
VRKQKLVENVDDIKDPTNPLKLKEEKLLNDFRDIKSNEKEEQSALKAIHDEIKSMQALIDANDKKMTKDFEFWYEIMLKKFEWESKNGKLDQFIKSTENTSTGSSVQLNNQSLLNNFFSSGVGVAAISGGNTSGSYSNSNTIINNGNNVNNSSISQLADRISRTKDLIMTDMHSKK